jgi:hypothetical protein
VLGILGVPGRAPYEVARPFFRRRSRLPLHGARKGTLPRARCAEPERINLLSTESLTTQVERVDRQVTDVSVRNWLLAALTVSSGAVDAISFLALGKIFTAFMTGNVAFLGMGIAGHPGAPRIVSVLASMAGFAGGVYLATKIRRSSQSAAHEGEQATGVVWPRLTTFALGISLLPHLCFLAIWFATSGRPVTTLFPFSLPSGRWRWGTRAPLFANLTLGAYLRPLPPLHSSSWSAIGQIIDP